MSEVRVYKVVDQRSFDAEQEFRLGSLECRTAAAELDLLTPPALEHRTWWQFSKAIRVDIGDGRRASFRESL
jgi:hypothetical protein